MVKINNFYPFFDIFSTDLTIYYFLFFLILSLKAFFVFRVGPLPDEAYYWLWSKKPDYSYYDHPPLSAWIQGFLSSFISNKQIQIRIIPTIAFSVIFLLNLHWINLIGKNNTSEKLKNSIFMIKGSLKFIVEFF